MVIELVPLTSITEMDAPEIFHPQRAKLLGEAMATLHGSMTWAPNDPEMIDRYPCEIPPFLDAASILSLGPFQDDGADSISRKDFLRACRSLSALEPALDQLRESWRCETLIHSDWKLANCLADPADPAAAPKIIDWESCDLGDPAWDCATLLQSYWTYWMTQPKLYDLTAIRPAAQAFWDGYCAKRGYDEAHSAAERTRAVRFAGARLIQTAWEWLDGEEQMTASAIRLLQASSNILKNPDAAEKMLFGDAAA